MTSVADALPQQPGAAGRGERLGLLAAFAAGLALTILVQAFNPGVTDVAWLFAVGERILDGERLYVDILEVNPPASLLIYLPALMVERATGLAAETVLLATLTAGLAAALVAADRILARARPLRHRPLIAFAVLAAVGALVGNCFGQREHVALVALLPILASIAAQIERPHARPPLRSLAVGLCAGAAIAIKPHFAAVVLLPQAYAFLRLRDLKVFFNLENWTIAAVGALYLASTAVLYPAFWSDVLPLVSGVYREARLPLADLGPAALIFLLAPLAFLVILRGRPIPPVSAVAFLAGAGFVLSFLEQGKGWPYHIVSGLALFLVAMVAMAARAFDDRAAGRADRVRLALAIVCILVLTGQTWRRTAPVPEPANAVEALVAGLAERPRIMSISGDLAMGHPLTRRVGGVWAASTPTLWVHENIDLIEYDHPERYAALAPSLARWAALERDRLVADLARRPDVILVDLGPTDRAAFFADPDTAPDWLDWALEDPRVGAILADYVEAGRTDDVAVLARRDLSDAPADPAVTP